MVEDKANHPGRTPKYADVREAVLKGFITRAEAKDLGKTVVSSGKFDNKAGRSTQSEETIARKVHKNAGLSQGGW